MSTTRTGGDGSLSFIGGLFARRRPEWDEEDRQAVLGELFFEGPEWRPFVARFATLIVLSTMIAGLGLIGDSSAVVIGAMLVAPLMTPILAVAGAAVHGQTRRLAVSSATLVGGTVAAIATGWFVAWAAPGTITVEELTTQLLARTAPSLIDLAVAVAAGLAGGYVLTHPKAGSSLPGVAIAVALVPPLATVGITLQIGTTDAARGALLLYTTNLVAIVLSAMVMMLLSGFVPGEVLSLVRGRVRAGLVIASLAVVAVAVPLTAHTFDVIADQRFKRQVLEVARDWDPAGRIVTLEAGATETRAVVDIVMASAQPPRPAWRLAEELSELTGTPVDVSVQYRLELRDEATAG